MKRLLHFLTVVMVSLLANAQTVEINGIIYNLDTETMDATVIAVNTAYSKHLIIPATIQDNGTFYSVSSIRQSAFRNNNDLTSIITPNSLTFIGDSAFYNCLQLKTVCLGRGVLSIGKCAFGNLPELTDFYCLCETVPQTDGKAFINTLDESGNKNYFTEPYLGWGTDREAVKDTLAQRGYELYREYDNADNYYALSYYGNDQEGLIYYMFDDNKKLDYVQLFFEDGQLYDRGTWLYI